MSQEYIKLYPEALTNMNPALTFECAPVRPEPHGCRGETYWGGKCRCWCHDKATNQRSKVTE